MHFLRKHTVHLRNRPVWLFHSGPVGPSAEDHVLLPHDVARLAELINATPVKTFAGELQADALIPHHRDLTDLVGDSRNWPEIKSWTHRIASTLAGI